MTAPLLCINAEQVHAFRYAGDYFGLPNCHLYEPIEYR